MGIGRFLLFLLVSYLVFTLVRRILAPSSAHKKSNQKTGSVRVFGKKGLEKSKIKNLEAEDISFEEVESKSSYSNTENSKTN